MERTSIITALYIAKSERYFLIELDAEGLPDNVSLENEFTKLAFVLEKAQLRQNLEDSDQGKLEAIEIRVNVHRESTVHETFGQSFVLVYLETANGEKHFIGTRDYPLSFSYTRDSGAGNADGRETTLEMGMRVPL
jgi:hypothetical protein